MTPDDFPGQRLRLLPRPLVSSALARNPTARMLVTDAGHFPHAANHSRSRPGGAAEAVIILCTHGRGSCDIDAVTVSVQPGEALVIPAGVAHLYRADPTDPWTIWWMHVTGADVPLLLAKVTGYRNRTVEVGDVFRAVALLEHVVTRMEQDETMASLLSAAGSAWCLLAQLAADKVAGTRRRADPVRAAREYLQRNLATPVSVPDLARMAGLSVSHFSALFRAATGGGVTDYVKRLRMARARELLSTTSGSVAEIARTVGYPDPFYFSRQFRAVNGCSPSTYREWEQSTHG